MSNEYSPLPDTDDEDDQRSELRYGLILLVIFAVLGAVFSPLVFPDVHIARSIIGGMLFGAFCTLCVAFTRFLR